MTENSDSRIIVATHFLELETPALSPFHPKSFSDIFSEDCIKRGRIDALSREMLRIMPSYIQAIGNVLDRSVSDYFSEAAKTSTIDHVPLSYMMDEDKIAEYDSKLNLFLSELGLGERAYLENRSFIQEELLQQDSSKEHDPYLEEFNAIARTPKYIFHLFTGNDCLNLLGRLFFALETPETPIYKRFIADALKYKFAGQILYQSAPLWEEGVLFDKTDTKDLTWDKLFRKVAIKADPRYLALKL